jgi:hypothetical protein
MVPEISGIVNCPYSALTLFGENDIIAIAKMLTAANTGIVILVFEIVVN